MVAAQETFDKKYALAALGVKFTHIIEAVSELMSVSPQDLIGPRKERAIVKARILVCYWAITELGMSMTETGKQLGISVSTVSVAVKKGRWCGRGRCETPPYPDGPKRPWERI
jgi:chromosomal replication initiation ATPase DnaA